MVMPAATSISAVTRTTRTEEQTMCHTSNSASIEIWQGNPETLTAQTFTQRQVHERSFSQVSLVHTAISETMSGPEDFSAGREKSAMSAAATSRAQSCAHGPGWWGWTAALVGASASQGALETFCGRLAQEGVRVISGQPEQTEDVSDHWMAAHAAVNVGAALVAGVRAGVHTYRALNNPDAYRKGLRGQRPPSPSPMFAAAGTPQVPASKLVQLSTSMGVALTAFLAASHTGLMALTQIGNTSAYKADAYNALVRSNGNIAYCYVREGVNLCSRAMGLISHDAMLSARGALAGTAQYLVNSLGQQAALSSLRPQQEGSIDYLWPCVSAAAEFVDVGFIAGASRFAEPERPVTLFNCRLAELKRDEPPPSSAPTIAQAVDRLTQRAVGRQLVAEMTRVLPFEAGAALRPHLGSVADTAATWGASVLASATHLREPIWQAERASQAAYP